MPTFPFVGLKEVTLVSLVIKMARPQPRGCGKGGLACVFVRTLFINAVIFRCCDVLSRQCYSCGS